MVNHSREYTFLYYTSLINMLQDECKFPGTTMHATPPLLLVSKEISK
jgi:hypothetical protein